MKAGIVLTKEEIAKVFLSPIKNLEDTNSFHCHISTLDNDSDVSSTSLNLESELIQAGSITPSFEPVSPATKLAEKEKKQSNLVIYEKFEAQSNLKNEKSSKLTELIEKLAELSKKYEKVEKTEDDLSSPEKITPDPIIVDLTECTEKGIKEPENEKKEERPEEEVKRSEKPSYKNEIKNSLTQIAIESRSKKNLLNGKSTQVVCAKCSII